MSPKVFLYIGNNLLYPQHLLIVPAFWIHHCSEICPALDRESPEAPTEHRQRGSPTPAALPQGAVGPLLGSCSVQDRGSASPFLGSCSVQDWGAAPPLLSAVQDCHVTSLLPGTLSVHLGKTQPSESEEWAAECFSAIGSLRQLCPAGV